MIAAEEEAPAAGAAWGPRTIEATKSAGATLSQVKILATAQTRAAPRGIATEASAAVDNPILSAIRGAQEAQAVIATVQKGCASPDALHEALQAAFDAGDPDRLRAFARRVQKALECRA